MSDCFSAPSSAGLATRKRLHAFLAARLSSTDDAERIIAQHLARALRWSDSLPAGTPFVVRWQQILRHAIVEHVRSGLSAGARDRAWQATVAISHDHHHPVLAGCFAPLIAELPVNEALLLHHVEILGQPFDTAGRELGHSPAEAAALFARAEARLRERLDQLFASLDEPLLPAPKEFPRHTLAQLRAERRESSSRLIPAGA